LFTYEKTLIIFLKVLRGAVQKKIFSDVYAKAFRHRHTTGTGIQMKIKARRPTPPTKKKKK
jgi:hypothetical protein